MALELQEINENPPQKFFHVFFPIHGTDEKAREDAIEEGATRLKLWHTQDPSSYWQKVVDKDTGNIVAGALWKIHKENLFASPQVPEITWFPDDSSRLFIAQALETHSAPRVRVAQKPHLCLFILFTHPDYRRKGVGQQVMDWGLKKADSLGYDFYLESTPYGLPLYEANNFVYLEEFVNHPETTSPDEKWIEVDKKVGLFTFWLMHKPAGGTLGNATTTKEPLQDS